MNVCAVEDCTFSTVDHRLGNLEAHLRRKHPKVYQEALLLKAEYMNDTPRRGVVDFRAFCRYSIDNKTFQVHIENGKQKVTSHVLLTLSTATIQSTSTTSTQSQMIQSRTSAREDGRRKLFVSFPFCCPFKSSFRYKSSLAIRRRSLVSIGAKHRRPTIH